MPGWLIFCPFNATSKDPAEIHTTLSRKLDIINAATSHRDLRSLQGTDTKSYPGNYRNTPPLE